MDIARRIELDQFSNLFSGELEHSIIDDNILWEEGMP
jgi:hypothetical protein